MVDRTFRQVCVALGGVGLAGWMVAGAQTPPADWASYGLNAAETRFSPAAELTAANVDRLGAGWTTPIGEGGLSQEATPLVTGGVMYVVTNWSVTAALDAKTGAPLWKWDPQVDQRINAPGSSRICCGVVNRGVALDRGKLFVPVIDGRLVALDARTGSVLWTAQATPKDDIAYTLTMAPRVVKEKVIVGNSGAEFPPYRGYFSAFDVNTGKEVWRFYTVPGDPSKPFENAALAAAAKSWTGEWWKYGGGGSVWDGMAYDAAANLLYVGTGNPAPWPISARESTAEMDNLYTSSILAVNPDTGELKWHYQATPGEQWDYDGTQQLLLADLRIGGRDRQVLMQAHKNGFFYVLDRRTGELISADPYTQVSWARGIDLKTGRPLVNPEARYGTAPVSVMPGGFGGHNWHPMAFSPTTGLVYFPGQLGTSFTYAAVDKFQFTPGVMNLGLNMGRGRGAGPGDGGPTLPVIGPDGQGNFLVAWDPVAKRTRWKQPGGGAGGGGALATAGNLVFQTINDGRLMAYAADTGALRFEGRIGGRGLGPPVAYTIEGRQYIAVMTPNPPAVRTFVLDGTKVQ